MINVRQGVFHLRNEEASYLFRVKDGFLEHLHFGARAETADALAFAADYAAFLRRGLNVPDSADRPTAEAVADRLLAGEDAELRKELEDFVKLADEIGIDDGSHGLLERFNGLFRQEWRAKEEPQPEVKAEMDEKMTGLPPLPELIKGKQERYQAMADRAMAAMESYRKAREER